MQAMRKTDLMDRLAHSLGNAFLLAADNTALVSLTSLLFGLEPVLLFAWLGLLTGTVIAALLPKKEKKETGNA